MGSVWSLLSNLGLSNFWMSNVSHQISRANLNPFFFKISAEDRQQLSKWFDILTCVSVMRQFLKTVWGFFSVFASPSYQQQQQQQTYTEANAFVLSKMRQPRDKKFWSRYT